MILNILSVIGTVFGFCFLTLSIASGLYYISELVEEHSEPTKRFLYKAIYVIIGILATCWLLDGLSFKLTLLSIVSHLVYRENLKRFPVISLTSVSFIASCVLVLLNHFLWFRYFSKVEIPPQFKFDPTYIPQRRATFAEVASFFCFCVWFVPFSLFVSLSAGDYLLAQSSSDAAVLKLRGVSGEGTHSTHSTRNRNVGLVRVVINSIRGHINTWLQVFGYRRPTEPLL